MYRTNTPTPVPSSLHPQSLSSDTPDILGGAQPTLILQAPPAAADDPGSVLVPTSVVEEWGTRLCCAADRRAAEEWMAGLKLT